MRTPACYPRNAPFPQALNGSEHRREIPGRYPANRATGSRSKVIVRPGRGSPTVTNDYRGYQKGVYVRFPEAPPSRLPQWRFAHFAADKILTMVARLDPAGHPV